MSILEGRCFSYFLGNFQEYFQRLKFFLKSDCFCLTMYIGVFLLLSGFGSIFSLRWWPLNSDEVTRLNLYLSGASSDKINARCPGLEYKYYTMACDKLIAELQIVYKDEDGKLQCLKKDLHEWTFRIKHKGNMMINL